MGPRCGSCANYTGCESHVYFTVAKETNHIMMAAQMLKSKLGHARLGIVEWLLINPSFVRRSRRVNPHQRSRHSRVVLNCRSWSRYPLDASWCEKCGNYLLVEQRRRGTGTQKFMISSRVLVFGVHLHICLIRRSRMGPRWKYFKVTSSRLTWTPMRLTGCICSLFTCAQYANFPRRQEDRHRSAGGSGRRH